LGTSFAKSNIAPLSHSFADMKRKYCRDELLYLIEKQRIVLHDNVQIFVCERKLFDVAQILLNRDCLTIFKAVS